MTSVEQNFSPPSPPTLLEEANVLQLIHPNLLEENSSESPPLAPLPLKNKENFIPGRFDYIKDEQYKKMLVNAWQAITFTENWEFLKKPCYSFSFSTDSKVNMIYNKMEELGYYGHSGSSFGCIMRDMQYIAENGEEKFKNIKLNKI